MAFWKSCYQQSANLADMLGRPLPLLQHLFPYPFSSPLPWLEVYNLALLFQQMSQSSSDSLPDHLHSPYSPYQRTLFSRSSVPWEHQCATARDPQHRGWIFICELCMATVSFSVRGAQCSTMYLSCWTSSKRTYGNPTKNFPSPKSMTRVSNPPKSPLAYGKPVFYLYYVYS